jgi:aromatic ring-cleaving dioxygenase
LFDNCPDIVMTQGMVGKVIGYHAHVYYDAQSRERAERVRASLGAAFNVRLGRWHDSPVGPHPTAMYQVAFAPDEFAKIVPWLMLNREDLNVLVHPETGDDLTDHTAHALWLGDKLELNTDVFG